MDINLKMNNNLILQHSFMKLIFGGSPLVLIFIILFLFLT